MGQLPELQDTGQPLPSTGLLVACEGAELFGLLGAGVLPCGKHWGACIIQGSPEKQTGQGQEYLRSWLTQSWGWCIWSM